MARRRIIWSEAKIKEYLKQGRGQGTGPDYKPWHEVQDFNSKGRTSRGPGWKTGREHHLFSDLESNYFYMLEWEDSVVDIREQYPLLDLELALTIAEKIGVKYPMRSGTPWVLTTDFYITVNDGTKEFNIARTIKPSIKLDEDRVIEKLEIERRYWLEKGVDWAIVTEQEIPRQLSQNIEWIHSSYRLEPTELLNLEDLNYYGEIIKRELADSERPIRKVLSVIEERHNLKPSTGLYIFKHLLARKEVLMDMNKKIFEGITAAEIISIRFKEQEVTRTV